MTTNELARIKMLLILAALCVFAPLRKATAQTNIEVFGQNRVQYRKFDWKYFDTRHFRVYHYDKSGRQLGRHVAEEAEYDMAVIEKKLSSQFPRRFNIILYNNYDEYRQSNIGLKDESPTTLGNTKAGSLRIVDDKLIVYFTGSHADIRRQIRWGMALVVMQRMLYGDNVKKAVKNSLLQNMPEWVGEGFIAYLVDGWDAKTNSEWRGLMNTYPNRSFYEISQRRPEIAGKAFWKFVSDQYGPNTVKTLLYAIQQKSDVNKAMKDKQTLNMKVTKAYDSCIKYYKAVYALDERKQEKPDSTQGVCELKVPKDGSILRNIRISPDGVNVAYVAWKSGHFTVLTQRASDKEAVPVNLLEGGQKDLTEQIDPNYPILAWSKTGSKLAILYKIKTGTYLRIYNHTRGRTENYTIPKNRFDRVLSMSFTEDDGSLIFSAVKKSQTDLYQFTIKGSKMVNITDDIWDDLSPQFISGGARTGILFLSNRPKPNMNVPVGVNELPAGPINVFFYNMASKSTELLQCSNIQQGSITQPIQYGPENFAYLHDSNGINNRYVVLFKRNIANEDSAYALPVTNYNTSILSHLYSPTTGYVADVIQPKKKYVTYFHDLVMPDPDKPKVLAPTHLSQETPEPMENSNVKIATDNIQPKVAKKRRTREPEPEPVYPEIKGGNAFQTEFSDNDVQPAPSSKQQDDASSITEDENPQNTADSTILTEINDSAYLKMKPATYKFSFKPDFLSIKIDNSILFNQYQSVDAGFGQFNNTGLSALTNISLNELMENHRFTAGFQLPISSPASTYFVQYQNLTRRLDWGLLYLRKQSKERQLVSYYDQDGQYLSIDVPQYFTTLMNMAQLDLSYPLDRLRSVRFHTAIREDKFTQKLADSMGLVNDFINTAAKTSASRLEFVFDNTIMPTMNILYGTRAKVFVEYMYGLDNGNKSCYNFGFDFRNYQKIYKHFIWANRIAYAHSDGNRMVRYVMGGIDNMLIPQPDSKAYLPVEPQYGFQMLATSLRGMKQFSRVGNNYAVISSELRLPIATTFAKRPIKSPFIKNLQLVGFIDAGTAWTGFLPDADALSPDYTFPSPVKLYHGTGRYLMQVPGPGQKGNPLQPVYYTVPYGNQLVAGYGLGLRTFMFGYFVRIDGAWNTEDSKMFKIQVGLGTDF